MDQPSNMGHKATAVEEAILKAEMGQGGDIRNEIGVAYSTTGLGLSGVKT